MKHFILRKVSHHIVVKKFMSSFDVVILGGGMVGSSLALALGRSPYLSDKKILLVDSEKEKSFENDSKYRSRVCALSPATKNLLIKIEAWKHIEEMRFRPVNFMQVWDAGGPSCISFGSGSNDVLAYIVENDLISHALTKEIKNLNNVEVLYNHKAVYLKLKTFEEPDLFPQVKLSNGEVVETSLLIGADGASSNLRKHSNIRSINFSYHQKAVVAVLTLEQLDNNNTAWQRFLPTGPIALLPLSSDKSCLIWSTTAELADQLTNCGNKEFVGHVNHAFMNEDFRNHFSSNVSQNLNLFVDYLQCVRAKHKLPPKVLEVNEESIGAFPLNIIHSTHYVKSRLALVGDAAHRLHPLSGQGLNLGFGDVESLTDILSNASANGADLGSIHHLLEYESNRQRQVLPMLLTVDAINRIYSSSFTPLVVARNLACQLFDAVPFIKNQMIQMASGIKN